MKLRILSIAAVAISGMILAVLPAAAAGPGPQDHTWNVTYSTTTLGGNADVTVTLGLGAGSAPGSGVPDTSFFHDATTRYAGIQPAPGNLGDNVGRIDFDIQTNATGAAGNIDPTTGQPPSCNGTGTLHPSIANVTILQSFAPTSAPTLAQQVSTKADPIHPGFSFDQEPDLAAGGVPMAVTHAPDWYAPVLNALNIPFANTTRGWGGATVLVNHTSVTFLTVNALGGNYAAVTVLGDPRGEFATAGQSTITCPPFSSAVKTLALSLSSGPPTGGGWTQANCNGAGTTDYFGTLMASYGACAAGSTAAPGGVSSNKITGTGCGATCPYKIALATEADLDSDGRFAGWDNCRADANAGQADANSNGIGDRCKGDTPATTSAVWLNSTGGALGNATVACGGVFNTLAPWKACQDADLDGALNMVDNCPLVPNAPLASWLKDSANNVLDNQGSPARDGLGIACSPVGNIPGGGGGYAPGLVYDGYSTTGAATGSPTWGTGTYRDWSDICDQGFTVGGAPLAATCQSTGGTDTILDSNNDGYADFSNAVAAGVPGGVCSEDHEADSNGDGYSDAMQATPHSTITGCAVAPAGGGRNEDPLGNASGCFTNPALAKADLNGNDAINSSDLTLFAGAFGKSVSAGTLFGAYDPKSESDFNHDNSINSTDLTLFASAFGKTVSTGATPSCVAQEFYSVKNGVYTVAWDRMGAGPHIISITCPVGTGGTSVAATNQTVVGTSGKVTYNGLTTTLWPDPAMACTFKIDGGANLVKSSKF